MQRATLTLIAWSLVVLTASSQEGAKTEAAKTIAKPGPIRRIQSLPAGWGVVADDVLAALAAAIVTALILLSAIGYITLMLGIGNDLTPTLSVALKIALALVTALVLVVVGEWVFGRADWVMSDTFLYI